MPKMLEMKLNNLGVSALDRLLSCGLYRSQWSGRYEVQ